MIKDEAIAYIPKNYIYIAICSTYMLLSTLTSLSQAVAIMAACTAIMAAQMLEYRLYIP
jgi:hypothetical protein